MGRPRGASPETVTLSLSDGDQLVVKAELTAGDEADALQGAVLRVQSADTGVEEIVLDRRALGFTKAAAFIVSWSLCDRTGAPIMWPVALADRVRVLREQLSGADWEEVQAAIRQHEAAQDAKKKSVPTGASAPGTTSSSAS